VALPRLEPNAQRLRAREVTQMGKAKKLTAAALAVLSLAAVPATNLALGNGEEVHVACTSGSGGSGCYG
jgi:hypothetical protein